MGWVAAHAARSDPAPPPAWFPDSSLYAFLQDAWPHYLPGVSFVGGWAVEAICLHLEAVSRGDLRRLVVNVPPRSLKSTIASVMWPAWEWTWNPGVRYLTASYAAELATRDAVRTRRLMQTAWFQSRWGDRWAFAGDQNVKARYENTVAGQRVSAGVGGLGTGEGGSRILADDPQSAQQAESAVERQAVIDWWDGTMSSRQDDPATAAMIVIQQRLHEDDLTGHLLRQGGYEHLVLPQEFEPDRRCATSIGWADPRTEDGELLAPERVGPPEIVEAKLRQGTRYWGQHQQRPAPAEGGVLKRENWRWFLPNARPAYRDVCVMADTAGKAGAANDWTVLSAWGEHDAGLDLIELWRGRWEFPQLVERAKAFWALLLALGYRPRQFVVEEKSSGIGLIQTLKQSTKLPVAAWTPTIPDPQNPKRLKRVEPDKVMRVDAISGYHAAGAFGLPLASDGSKPPHLEGDPDSLVAECAVFPNGRHDDQVDALTMAGYYWIVAPPKRGLTLAGPPKPIGGKMGWYKTR